MKELSIDEVLPRIKSVLDTEYAKLVGQVDYSQGKEEAQRREHHYLALQESLVKESLEPLFLAFDSKQLSLSEVLLFLRTLASIGSKHNPEDHEDGEELDSQYRSYNVRIGFDIPPHYSDVELLMNRFLGSIEELIKNDISEEDETMFLTWIYLVLTAIHPYTDGNGRTGRAFVKFFDHYLQRKRGCKASEIEERSFPDRSYLEHSSEVGVVMANVMAQMGLTYSDKGNVLSSKKTPVETYFSYLEKGKELEYFQKLKKSILDHINETSSVTALISRNSQYLEKLARYLGLYKYIKIGQTKPLVAVDGLKEFKQLID